MAEYIERETAAKAFEELLLSPYADVKGGPFNAGARDALKIARDMMRDKVPCGMKIPTADVKPVVRCRGCKRWETCRTSTTWAVAPGPDWFCADGIKREKESTRVDDD